MLASSDFNSTIIWIVVVVGIAVVNYLRETLKKGDSEKEDHEGSESTQAQKVRRIIQEMKQSSQGSTSRRPSYPDPPASSLPSFGKQVSREPRRAVVAESSDRVDYTVQTAGKSAFEVAEESMQAAKQSINSLSEPEQRALEKLKEGKISLSAPNRVAAIPASASVSCLASGLRSREALRMAILYREILGEPIALRKHGEGFGL